jgi:hypothetical protein
MELTKLTFEWTKEVARKTQRETLEISTQKSRHLPHPNGSNLGSRWPKVTKRLPSCCWRLHQHQSPQPEMLDTFSQDLHHPLYKWSLPKTEWSYFRWKRWLLPWGDRSISQQTDRLSTRTNLVAMASFGSFPKTEPTHSTKSLKPLPEKTLLGWTQVRSEIDFL